MTNIQASMGISQLRNLDVTVKKMSIGKYYYDKLNKHKNIYMTPPKINFSKNIYWVVGILIKNKKILASQMIKKLNSLGIGCRPFFCP